MKASRSLKGSTFRGLVGTSASSIWEDLYEVYGKERVNLALGTSDRHEVIAHGILKRAEWQADFEAERATLQPTGIAAITPDLAAHLTARVRAHVLAEDDRVRSDVKLLAEMVQLRHELRRRQLAPGYVLKGEPTETRDDDSSDLTPEEARELAGFNACLDAQAASALAAGNLKTVVPLVEAPAAFLGFDFEAKTPRGVRERLIACLRALKTTHREVTMRDAGEVVDTPVVPLLQSSAPSMSTEKPKNSRDIFDRWKLSGALQRSDDSVLAMDRALRQFEGRHAGAILASIEREMGLDY